MNAYTKLRLLRAYMNGTPEQKARIAQVVKAVRDEEQRKRETKSESLDK